MYVVGFCIKNRNLLPPKKAAYNADFYTTMTSSHKFSALNMVVLKYPDDLYI